MGDQRISEQKEDKEPTLKEKTAKGLFWGGIGSFIQQFIGLAFNVFIVRILTPDDYGLVTMLAIFTAIANSIMDSGFTTALINRTKIKNEDYNAVFWFNAIAGVVMYIVLFGVAPMIADFYDKPVLINLSRLLFLSFIFSSLGIAHNAFLLKNIMAKERSIIDFTAVFFSGLIGLILALNGFAFWGLAIQIIAQTATATVLRWFFCPWRPTFKINFAPLKEMFGFSSKMFLTNIITQVTSNILSTIFGRLYGEHQTGNYGQGHKWGTLGTSVITGMINGIAQPVLINAVDDKQRQKNILRKIIRFGAFVSFPSLLGFAFAGEEFILVLVGVKWINSLFYLRMFCLWGSVTFLWYLYTSLLFTHNKSNIYMWGMLCVSVLQIAITLALYSFGAKVMTIAFILCYFIGLIFWHHFVKKIIGLNLREVIKDIFPYLASTILCIIITWFITKDISNIYIRLTLKIIIMGVMYLVIMWYSNSVIIKESFRYIKQKISKS